MPLTAQEKNLIAEGGTLAAQQTIIAEAGLGLLGATGVGLVFLPIILGLQSLFRQRSPTGPDVGVTTQMIVDLSRRGLDPRLSVSPFTGDTVVSTRDQDAVLARLIRQAAIQRVVAEQDTSRLFLQRRLLIEGLAESAEERGFATTIDPNLRGGVFRPSAEAPLEFREGRDFLL